MAHRCIPSLTNLHLHLSAPSAVPPPSTPSTLAPPITKTIAITTNLAGAGSAHNSISTLNTLDYFSKHKPRRTMVLKRVLVSPAAAQQQHQQHHGYSVTEGAAAALKTLLAATHRQLPSDFIGHLQDVSFVSPSTAAPDGVFFPCPLREQEAAAAIKALEACAAAAIADLRYGAKARAVEVDLTKTACFLISAYMSTIDGMDKTHEGVKSKIPGTHALFFGTTHHSSHTSRVHPSRRTVEPEGRQGRGRGGG